MSYRQRKKAAQAPTPGGTLTAPRARAPVPPTALGALRGASSQPASQHNHHPAIRRRPPQSGAPPSSPPAGTLPATAREPPGPTNGRSPSARRGEARRGTDARARPQRPPQLISHARAARRRRTRGPGRATPPRPLFPQRGSAPTRRLSSPLARVGAPPPSRSPPVPGSRRDGGAVPQRSPHRCPVKPHNPGRHLGTQVRGVSAGPSLTSPRPREPPAPVRSAAVTRGEARPARVRGTGPGLGTRGVRGPSQARLWRREGSGARSSA